MTFGLYIRIIMQQYLFLLIISLSELYLFRFNSEDHFTSKIFSAVLLSICHAIVLVWFWVVFVPTTEQKEQTEQTDQSQTKRRLWAHWTNGLQDKLWKRIFAILFFIRRIVFWVLILLFKDLSMYLKVWSYSAIQLSYIAILCFLRPFQHTKDMLSNWVNEGVYFVLCILLTFFNTEDRWSLAVENMYIWIIISNNLILIILDIVFWFKWKSKTFIAANIEKTEVYKVEPKPPLENNQSVCS